MRRPTGTIYSHVSCPRVAFLSHGSFFDAFLAACARHTFQAVRQDSRERIINSFSQMKAKIFSSRLRLFRTALIMLICLMLLLFLLSAPKFEDGFESGLSLWGTGGTIRPITVETQAHHGRYSVSFSSSGGQDSRSYINHTLSPTLDLYARGYFYISESGLVNQGDRSSLIMFRAGAGENSTPLAYTGWRNADGVVKWYLTLMNGSASALNYSVTVSDLAPSTNRWYSVELHWREGPGMAEVWVDDVMACSVNGKLASGYGGVDTIRFGLGEIAASGPTILYLDCAAINSSRIGMEPSQRWWLLAVGAISAGVFLATFLASRRRTRTGASMSQDEETVIY